ncbi:hypothetical protein C8A03DRAFT_47259 [Achaetomium macrosporum]|uniref:Zn(2)-C6 fungal-type domain-containing protein n=1 Tax=Achaetomium macrosporum TaxID=79813 RepID=A0AAN7HB06_9PEZI|nr:hypothetical protein C8A03DRAFT_47259 [Achaetomium macrosporum]
MRHTLRRSCSACAKSKHSCDLGTPRCSRCIKRGIQCLYANEPLTAVSPGVDKSALSGSLSRYRFASLDPFDSYPPTRLHRDHVQRLIHVFCHKIAFQYYPLDLNAATNPFLVSWWPLALGDPALFNISLQAACLDEELLAQKGFHTSELLMADSVALLRRKVQDASLAVQDGTMNSVITLATIEFGKGNIKVAEMHVDGVKRLVELRGGINAVRQTSPLTARMVSWVSMLIMGHPQFETQDDAGVGHGIPPIPEWQWDPSAHLDVVPELSGVGISSEVRNVFLRLRNVFHCAQTIPLPSTRLHDLTCFVIHRLLLSVPDTASSQSSVLTECVRYATILYMFTIQGPTYYSHAVIFNQILNQFAERFKEIESMPHIYNSLHVWLVTIGMAASAGTPHYQWFTDTARAVAALLQLGGWDDVLSGIQSILWLETHGSHCTFQVHWGPVLDVASHAEPPGPQVVAARLSPGATRLSIGFI